MRKQGSEVSLPLAVGSKSVAAVVGREQKLRFGRKGGPRGSEVPEQKPTGPVRASQSERTSQSERNAKVQECLNANKDVLHSLFRALTNDRNLQDDLFQEFSCCLTQAVGQNSRLGDGQSLKRFAYRCAMRWLRRWRRQPRRLAPRRCERRGIATEGQPDLRLQWLRSELKKLKAHDQQLVEMLFTGHSYRDIAEHLGGSKTYVGVRISRIKERLRTLRPPIK